MGRPPVIGHQLDRCDICGEKKHKIHLVRTNVEFLAAEAQNYFTHSSYNSAAWETPSYGTDAGVISIGPYGDESRVSISSDNTRTEISGSQTWNIGAAVGDYTGLFRIQSASIDISSWTSFVFSFDWGFYQQDQNPDATAWFYVYDADGVNGNITKKYLRGSGGRYWHTVNVADINSSCDLTRMTFYILIGAHSGGEKVWFDRVQLEKDVTKMSAFVPTYGSSIDRTDTPMMTVRKVCSGCWEPLLSKTERYGREAEKITDDPIMMDIQEV
jgi:hypothetical protein